ncbi:MAG: hypothetical protein ACRYG8_34020 [Janthinobacterium lividum]
MFTRVGSLIGAAISELIVAATATCLHPTIPIMAWLCFGVLILLWRLGIFVVAGCGKARVRPGPTGVLAASSLVWSANLGVGGMLCNLSGDLAVWL